jgi:hypothetical protein
MLTTLVYEACSDFVWGSYGLMSRPVAESPTVFFRPKPERQDKQVSSA